MKLDKPIFELSSYNEIVEDIKFLLNEDTSNMWNLWTLRQDNFPPHKDTLSVGFKWLYPTIPNNRTDLIETTINNSSLYELIEKVVSEIIKSNQVVVRLMLVNLPANKSINEHTDNVELRYIHRLHFPVLTNNLVDFVIDNEVFHMQEGIWYEFDNTRLHSVHNRSNKDRIHLIADILDLE